MSDDLKVIKAVLKQTSPELEAVKHLSELEKILKKNNLEILLRLFSCSCDDCCMHLSGCVSSKNPFDVTTTIFHYLDDDWNGEEFEVHTISVPLLAEDELEAWEKSYVERLKRELLAFVKD